jgi:hypothetical protein
VAWHSTAIRKYLVPYVTPLSANDPAQQQVKGGDIALLCLDGDAARAMPADTAFSLVESLPPGCVVVLPDPAGFDAGARGRINEKLNRVETVGRLQWGRVRS